MPGLAIPIEEYQREEEDRNDTDPESESGFVSPGPKTTVLETVSLSIVFSSTEEIGGGNVDKQLRQGIHELGVGWAHPRRLMVGGHKRGVNGSCVTREMSTALSAEIDGWSSLRTSF